MHSLRGSDRPKNIEAEVSSENTDRNRKISVNR